jgi:multicomponent Na+:H+ antiporter subunit F
VICKDKWNRLLGLNLVGAKMYMLILIWALVSDRTYYLDIALVYVILGYIGIKVLTEYIVERGKKVNDSSNDR